MSELYKKMVYEAIAAQRADFSTIDKNRGKEFKIKDAESYVKVVGDMKLWMDKHNLFLICMLIL